MTPTPITTAAQTPLLYTIQQVAELLHVHPQTVRSLHRSGELGFVKNGKYHLTTADQLDKYINDHRSD
jgi:excisionase family DNA binding protein